MRLSFYISLPLLFLECTSDHTSTDKEVDNRPPNIIVIYTDDQGFADLGIQGQVADIRTPNIDQLARDGARMTSGYTIAPQCIPSRAGLLTGRYPQQFGLGENNTIPLPLDELLIPQRLKKAGYVTGQVGKWHLEPNHLQELWLMEHLPELKDEPRKPGLIPFEATMDYQPSRRGFDEVYNGSMISYMANFDLDGNSIPYQRVIDKRFRLDVQSDAAVTFIERNHDTPFFLYLSFFGPHVPLEGISYYLNQFPGDMPKRRRYCLAMMAAIDDGVGRVRETLNKHSIEENTIIFFISDNGAPYHLTKEDKPISFPGGAWDGSLNNPYNGEKSMLLEGGIHVPFIVSWPGTIPQGITYKNPVSTLDVAATSIAVAGLSDERDLDGVNLIPYLTGEKDGVPHEAIYWRFTNQSAIRMGDWKFLKRDEEEYLFDLINDPGEQNNLKNSIPEQAKKLRNHLNTWLVKLPPSNLDFDGPWPGYEGYFDSYLKAANE